MGFSYQLFLFALLLPLASCANLIYENCGQNITNNDILQNNIHKAIYSTVANGSYGHATSAIGDGNNTVYGLASCRGDLSAKDCSDCLAIAACQLRTSCPDSAESRIWYDVCSLHHSNINFFGIAETNDYKAWCSIKKPADPIAFDTTLWQLLDWVKLAAESGTTKFATGKIVFNANTTIYGMAQCTKDLGKSECTQCLAKMTSLMSACKDSIGSVYISGSCYLRYEISNFLNIDYIPIYPDNAATPAPAPLSQISM